MRQRYIIDCSVQSMMLLSLHTSSLYTSNYFIMNPFTQKVRNIGPICIGPWGFFSLLDKTSDGKYGWVVLKHDIETPHDRNGRFYIASSLHRPWTKTTPPYGRIPPPRMQIFLNNTIWWLDLNEDHEEFPKYGYSIYSFDLLRNRWAFSFVPLLDIRSMTLAIYKEQLVFIINRGPITVWSIEEVQDFDFGELHMQWSYHCFEDEWGFKWTCLQTISANINATCAGYLPFSFVNEKVFMCDYGRVAMILYDLLTN